MQARYAGFWIRFVAHWIDNFLLSLISLIPGILGLFAAYGIRFSEAFDPALTQMYLLAVYMVCAFPYYVVTTYIYGGSPGKLALRLKVVDAKTDLSLTLKQSIVRCLGYLLSWPLTLGYLLAAFHPRKQALHDLLAGTVVIYREKANQG